jgi:hypothetical protein
MNEPQTEYSIWEDESITLEQRCIEHMKQSKDIDDWNHRRDTVKARVEFHNRNRPELPPLPIHEILYKIDGYGLSVQVLGRGATIRKY